MAWQKTYSCRQCGYQAVVYEGKGFMGQHITMITCSDCHTIQPLVVGVLSEMSPHLIVAKLGDCVCIVVQVI